MLHGLFPNLTESEPLTQELKVKLDAMIDRRLNSAVAEIVAGAIIGKELFGNRLIKPRPSSCEEDITESVDVVLEGPQEKVKATVKNYPDLARAESYLFFDTLTDPPQKLAGGKVLQHESRLGPTKFVVVEVGSKMDETFEESDKDQFPHHCGTTASGELELQAKSFPKFCRKVQSLSADPIITDPPVRYVYTAVALPWQIPGAVRAEPTLSDTIVSYLRSWNEDHTSVQQTAELAQAS
jgi:hypothetical protein